jgi:hypothetical protein
MSSSEGVVCNHSRKRALRSPDVAALNTLAATGSRAERSKGLEDVVTVKTLKRGACAMASGLLLTNLQRQCRAQTSTRYFRLYLGLVNPRPAYIEDLGTFSVRKSFYILKSFIYIDLIYLT